MRFALREDVLNAVSRYLGVVPFLSTISVLFSDVVKGAPTSSQLHHCDGDDVTQVKIFIYCSDVDPGSGPLTLLPADDSQRVRRGVGYQYRQRLTDEQVAGVVGQRARGADSRALGHLGVRGHEPVLPLRLARGGRRAAAAGDDDPIPDAVLVHGADARATRPGVPSPDRLRG